MNELILILIPLLIVDMINPVLFAGVVYGLGSRHPVINTWNILVSFFLSYFLAGLIFAETLDLITRYAEIPLFVDYILEFIIALLLLYFARKMYKSGDEHRERKLVEDKDMSAWEAVIMGLTINIVGLPFALPYLAAIDQILKFGINPYVIFCVLLAYNIIYILPFASMVIIRWIYQKESNHIFETINAWIHRVTEKYLPFLFLFIGLLLLEDCISYFLGYREYSLLNLNG